MDGVPLPELAQIVGYVLVGDAFKGSNALRRLLDSCCHRSKLRSSVNRTATLARVRMSDLGKSVAEIYCDKSHRGADAGYVRCLYLY